MIIAISGQAMGQSAGMSPLGSRSPIGGARFHFLRAGPKLLPLRSASGAPAMPGATRLCLVLPTRRLRAVVAQVPTISGFEQGLRRVAPDGIAALERAFAEDDRGQLRGEPLRRQLVVSDVLAIPACYHNKDAIDFYLQPTPPGIWENSV